MAIKNNRGDREQKKFKESTAVANQVGVVVLNPDGSNISAGSVTSIVPGTGATNLGKAEDAVHASGDVGVFSLSVANEAQTTLAADGDYIARSADTKGNTVVVGNVASGATDAGNPQKTGGAYRSTQPTLTDGQRGDTQVDTRANTKVTLMTMDSANQVTTASTNSDAVATSAIASRWQVNSLGMSFDGTNYNRDRVVSNGLDSAGTGIKAAGIVAQLDDTATSTVTENQFGNLRLTPNRALMVENRYTYGRATADTQIKASAGFVHTVSIAPLTATPTAGLLTIYDNTAESGTVIYSEWVFATTPGHTVTLDVNAATGIYASFDAALANVQVTVAFR